MAARDSAIQMPLPNDLAQIVAGLDSADHEAKRLITELNHDQLNWQPNGGSAWSVAQCLEHLAQCNKIYVAAMREAARRSSPAMLARRGPIRPGWLGRLFIRALEPPPRKKMKAQKKVTPTSTLRGSDVLNAFLAAHDDVRSLIEEARGIDLNAIRFRNPFVRLLPWTLGTGLLVIDAHDRRHLWQARQVVQAMKNDGPASTS